MVWEPRKLSCTRSSLVATSQRNGKYLSVRERGREGGEEGGRGKGEGVGRGGGRERREGRRREGGEEEGGRGGRGGGRGGGWWQGGQGEGGGTDSSMVRQSNSMPITCYQARPSSRQVAQGQCGSPASPAECV